MPLWPCPLAICRRWCWWEPLPPALTWRPIDPTLHDRTLVLHGETDDTVPLADAMNWARPQGLPITVVPGVGHFFHGQLPLLRAVIARHLRTV